MVTPLTRRMLSANERSRTKMPGVAAEGGFEGDGIERLEEVAQGVDGERAAHPGAEDRVEPFAVHPDER